LTTIETILLIVLAGQIAAIAGFVIAFDKQNKPKRKRKPGIKLECLTGGGVFDTIDGEGV